MSYPFTLVAGSQLKITSSQLQGKQMHIHTLTCLNITNNPCIMLGTQCAATHFACSAAQYGAAFCKKFPCGNGTVCPTAIIKSRTFKTRNSSVQQEIMSIPSRTSARDQPILVESRRLCYAFKFRTWNRAHRTRGPDTDWGWLRNNCLGPRH